jgi:type II secretory pathway pseudopilin PulG
MHSFLKPKSESGDTLVEVLMAIVVASIVVAAAYTLTTRATRLNQTAFERTASANLMREQIEFVRGMQISAADSPAWQSIISNYTVSTSPNYTNCQPTVPSAAFFVDSALDYANPLAVRAYTPGNDLVPADVFEVWMEAYQPSGQNYIYIHARACWEGIGGEVEQRGSVVLRLAV